MQLTDLFMLLAKAIGLQQKLAYDIVEFLLGMLAAAILETHRNGGLHRDFFP